MFSKLIAQLTSIGGPERILRAEKKLVLDILAHFGEVLVEAKIGMTFLDVWSRSLNDMFPEDDPVRQMLCGRIAYLEAVILPNIEILEPIAEILYDLRGGVAPELNYEHILKVLDTGAARAHFPEQESSLTEDDKTSRAVNILLYRFQNMFSGVFANMFTVGIGQAELFKLELDRILQEKVRTMTDTEQLTDEQEQLLRTQSLLCVYYQKILDEFNEKNTDLERRVLQVFSSRSGEHAGRDERIATSAQHGAAQNTLLFSASGEVSDVPVDSERTERAEKKMALNILEHFGNVLVMIMIGRMLLNAWKQELRDIFSSDDQILMKMTKQLDAISLSIAPSMTLLTPLIYYLQQAIEYGHGEVDHVQVLDLLEQEPLLLKRPEHGSSFPKDGRVLADHQRLLVRFDELFGGLYSNVFQHVMGVFYMYRMNLDKIFKGLEEGGRSIDHYHTKKLRSQSLQSDHFMKKLAMLIDNKNKIQRANQESVSRICGAKKKGQ